MHEKCITQGYNSSVEHQRINSCINSLWQVKCTYARLPVPGSSPLDKTGKWASSFPSSPEMGFCGSCFGCLNRGLPLHPLTQMCSLILHTRRARLRLSYSPLAGWGGVDSRPRSASGLRASPPSSVQSTRQMDFI